MMSDPSDLPSCTIVIEWENAIDVDDEWARRAVAGLERELAATAPLMRSRPVVSYLFNSEVVKAEDIERAVAEATTLRDHARVEIVPTKGLSYYELKNQGAARAVTEVSIFLDSDAAPQPGWLRGMLAPFADPAIMAVGGITVLGYEDFFSRTLALSWIFGLVEERAKTAGRWGIYANNTAVRTVFFRNHPFQPLKAYKYQCVFWLRSILAQGYGYVRVADAVTVHAPHPSYRFYLWRAWVTGLDRDFYVNHVQTRSLLGRGVRACAYFMKRTVQSSWRIASKRRSVGLPAWQVPGAMVVSLAFTTTALVAQFWSLLSRRHEDLPPARPRVGALPTSA